MYQKGAGLIVVVLRPSGIEPFMGDDEMPILTANSLFIPVNSNLIQITDMTIISDGGRQNFSGIGSPEPFGWISYYSGCGGKHCTRLEQSKNGRVRDRRPCYQMTSRNRVPMIAIDF